MGKMTIEESVAVELAYIGSAKKLGNRINQRINDLDRPGVIDAKRYPSVAEKTAIKSGWNLEVSWAETESQESAKYHEAALIQWYIARHCQVPSFGNRPPGEWILGNMRVERVEGPVSDLNWLPWMPMVKSRRREIPATPGVYRIRATTP